MIYLNKKCEGKGILLNYLQDLQVVYMLITGNNEKLSSITTEE